MPTLKVVSGPAAGQTLEVDRQVVIGREGADLMIDDPKVSRRHTAVRPTEHGVEIEDLGSRNGTLVNGRRIAEPVTLTVGGSIQVGSSVIEVELALGDRTRVSTAPAPAPPPTRVAAAPPQAEQQPEQPAPPPPAPAGARRRRTVALAGLGVLAAAIAFAIVALVASGDDDEDEATKRAFRATASSALVTEPGLKLTAAGFVQGAPVGKLAALIDRTVPEPNVPGGPAVPLDLRLAFSQPGGSINARFSGTVKLTRKGVEIVRGRARVSSGTGKYEGIKGSFTLRGDNPAKEGVSRFRLNGTLEY
jgi:hypothetical protein